MIPVQTIITVPVVMGTQTDAAGILKVDVCTRVLPPFRGLADTVLPPPEMTPQVGSPGVASEQIFEWLSTRRGDPKDNVLGEPEKESPGTKGLNQ